VHSQTLPRRDWRHFCIPSCHTAGCRSRPPPTLRTRALSETQSTRHSSSTQIATLRCTPAAYHSVLRACVRACVVPSAVCGAPLDRPAASCGWLVAKIV
jgi:hypothetical protein